MHLSSMYKGHVPELKRRQSRRTTFVFTCMDERMFSAEDRLSLLPGEAIAFSSSGGKIEIDDLTRIYNEKINHSIKAHRQTAIYFITHECASKPELGCSGFPKGVASQTVYFSALRNKLMQIYPKAFIHVLMLNTANGKIMPLEMDNRDDHLADVISRTKNLIDTPPTDIEHAGYGIYIGDAYHAWVREDNTYFRLSCLNPNLGNDIRTALKIMEKYAIPPFAKGGSRPIIIHLDYPIYSDIDLNGHCRHNMESQTETLLKEKEIQKMMNEGQLNVMRTETEMNSWRGMDIS